MNFCYQKVTIPDRRGKPRINCRFPVVIRAHDADGKKYQVLGKLSDLSASGMHFWVNHEMQIGEKVFVMIQLSKSGDEEEKNRLVISGHVLRTEPQPDGVIGVAIECERYQFL